MGRFDDRAARRGDRDSESAVAEFEPTRPRSKATTEGIVASKREGDGLDPRFDAEMFFGDGKSEKVDRKLLMLAKQVSRSLDLTLSSSLDPVLQDVSIGGVTPLSSREMLVTVVDESGTPSRQKCRAILQALDEHKAEFKEALASDLSRKHIPALFFQVQGKALSTDVTDGE